MILNNQHLGMVVQWEDRFYGSLRGNTILGDVNTSAAPTIRARSIQISPRSRKASA